MRRVRPTKVMTAAGVFGIAFGLLSWAADAAWARSAGLDVWNLGRLEDQLRDSGAEAARLRAREAVLVQQYEVNRQLVRDVFDGRWPLAAAAEALWVSNRELPGFETIVLAHYRGPTPAAKAAHNLLCRIEQDDRLPADRKPAELARLRAEYAAAFGVPAP